MPMLLRLLLMATLTGSASAQSNDVDVVGSWRVNPKTVQMGHLPTNFLAFSLTLKDDGRFIATNVPSGFFFHGPATSEARGSWKLTYEPRDREYYFSLDFSTPEPLKGSWGTVLMWRRPFLSPKEPLIRIYISPRKPDHSDALEFGLARKQ